MGFNLGFKGLIPVFQTFMSKANESGHKRQCDWWSQLPPLLCYCVDHSQLNLSLCEGDYLHVLCTNTVIQLFHVFYAPKKCLQFSKTLMILCFLTFMWPYIMLNFLQLNQLDAIIYQIYSWNETVHVADSSSVHHQEIFTVHTAMLYVIQVCWQLASRIRMELQFHPDPAPVWHIPLLCVLWKFPDDGQRNCPQHVQFHSKNKFDKLLHLVCFIIRKFVMMHAHMDVKVIAIFFL